MEMTFQDIVHFLHLIGVDTVVTDTQRGWARCSCPLAPWLHAGGSDRKPSFGVKMPEKDGEAPYYTCFTCGSNGPLPKLLHNMTLLSGDRLPAASGFLSQFEVFSAETYETDKETDTRQKARRIYLSDKYANLSLNSGVNENLPVPQSILDNYPLLSEQSEFTAHAEALKWLAFDRKINLQSIAKFRLRLFTNDIDDVGVIFPIIDIDGVTVLDMWARLIDRKNFFRVTSAVSHSNVDYKAPNLLFGNHIFDPQKPVILVEGAIDALRLHSLGIPNVLASMGGLSNDQIDGLYAPVVYLGFDNDDAGRGFSKKAIEKLQVPSISVLDWGVVGIKDAGELESLAQFRQVFDQRTKILRDKTGKKRTVDNKQSARKVFLGEDGSFL